MNIAKLILIKKDSFKTTSRIVNQKDFISLRQSILLQYHFLKCKIKSPESDNNRYMYTLKFEKLIEEILTLISKEDIYCSLWIKLLEYISEEMNLDKKTLKIEKQMTKKQKRS